MKKEEKRLCVAFVQGAKWWEFSTTKFTMWQSDQEKAWNQAVRLLAERSLGITQDEFIDLMNKEKK